MGGVVRGTIGIGGNCRGSNCLGVIVRGSNGIGGNCAGGIVWGANGMGDNCPGGNGPRAHINSPLVK